VCDVSVCVCGVCAALLLAPLLPLSAPPFLCRAPLQIVAEPLRLRKDSE